MWLVVTGRTGVDHSMRSGTCGGSLESGLRRGICGHLELGLASRHTEAYVPVRAISLVVSDDLRRRPWCRAVGKHAE